MVVTHAESVSKQEMLGKLQKVSTKQRWDGSTQILVSIHQTKRSSDHSLDFLIFNELDSQQLVICFINANVTF